MHTNKLKFLNKGVFFPFLTASLKGISQVFLIENITTGLLILVAITITSPYLGLIALFSSFIGTLVAKLGGADEKSINQGLLGFNSVVTGMAFALFLNGPYVWFIALIGSAVAAIFTAAMMHFIKKTEVPILTFPYIILTWFVLLSTYNLKNMNISPKLIPQELTNWKVSTAGDINLIDAIINGIGQIVFLDNTISGVLLFIAIFLAGRKLGFYSIIGSVAAVIIAFAFGGDHTLIKAGLYGYNAILTIIAVSEVFTSEQNRLALLSGVIAACLTIPITAGMSTFLLPYGLPTLTMPFVLCTWIFLGARKLLPNL